MPRVRLGLSLEAARDRLLQLVSPLEPVSRPLHSAAGLRLATSLLAPIDLPRFTNSAMDGFAVHAVDTAAATLGSPVRLNIIDALEAGEFSTRPVGAFETIRVSTGAAFPAVCDAVIPAELAREGGSFIEITAPIAPGRNVRRRGEDIEAGAIAIEAGIRLRAQEIGLLAGLGIEQVDITPRPSVSILSIGPELFPISRPLQVYDANGPMLAAQVTMAGGEVVRLERCDGNPPLLERMLAELGSVSDLIITSGGISDSTADTMAELLERQPSSELWNVRLRPGKHFGIGSFEGYRVLALPGNPIAAFVGFELLGRRMIERLAGSSRSSDPVVAVAAEPMSGTPGRVDALRGTARVDADGQLRVSTTENRGSAILSSLPQANCLILVPEGSEQIAARDRVEIVWLDRP